MADVSTCEITLHGNRVSYRCGGSGPLLVLIHGITSSSASWEPVLPALAEHFTILAPDLLGHGQSDKPAGDYSLGSHACIVRDLMLALGHERGTIAGHSLGGGIAMQVAYQFPELVERLVLVSSGGLGREVSVFLRAVTLPGSELVLPLIASRAVLDAGGQRVDARDRLYLAQAVPSLIVWGGIDPIIPAEHGRRAHGLMPGSRLEVFDHAGHFPHLDDPLRFDRVLRSFVASTEAADVQPGRARELMLAGAA